MRPERLIRRFEEPFSRDTAHMFMHSDAVSGHMLR